MERQIREGYDDPNELATIAAINLASAPRSIYEDEYSAWLEEKFFRIAEQVLKAEGKMERSPP